MSYYHTFRTQTSPKSPTWTATT